MTEYERKVVADVKARGFWLSAEADEDGTFLDAMKFEIEGGVNDGIYVERPPKGTRLVLEIPKEGT